MRSFSVRARLTLWYLTVTSAGLILFGLLSFGALRYALFRAKQATIARREHRMILFLKENKAQPVPLPLSEQLQSYAIAAHEGNLVQIRNSDGSLLFPLDAASARWMSLAPENCAEPVFRSLTVDDQPATVMCHIILLNGRTVRLYIGGSLEENQHILRIYLDTLLLILPCLLSLAAISGYLLSRQAMRPVDHLTRAALNIGIGNLSARVPVPPANDELRSLAIAWNQLLGRLEEAVSRLSQFSADVSHDLRTSITVMLATAQLSLHRRRTEEEYRDDLARIVTECRTASTLIDALLSLARSDTFQHEVAFRRINICDLVIASCRRVEDLAESSGIMLDWRLTANDVFVEGDELLLQRLLGILLDNAIKYTPEHGEIRAEVSRTASEVIVAVHDTGIGISEDVRQHIFDRFYQADLRERKTQAGSGLGLSIARWIAEAHHARLAVESIPMKGSIFQICFPVSIHTHSTSLREQLVR